MSLLKLIEIVKVIVEAATSFFNRKKEPKLVEASNDSVGVIEMRELPIEEIIKMLTVEEIRNLRIDQIQEELKKRLAAGYKWSDIEPILIQGLKPSLGPDRAVKKSLKIKGRLEVND